MEIMWSAVMHLTPELKVSGSNPEDTEQHTCIDLVRQCALAAGYPRFKSYHSYHDKSDSLELANPEHLTSLHLLQPSAATHNR